MTELLIGLLVVELLFVIVLQLRPVAPPSPPDARPPREWAARPTVRESATLHLCDLAGKERHQQDRTNGAPLDVTYAGRRYVRMRYLADGHWQYTEKAK